MRRLIVLPAALLLLSSCAMKSDIPAEQVLDLSSRANRNVRSASFDLQARLVLPSVEGTATTDATLSGVMQNGGKQLQFDLDAEGVSAAGNAWDARGRFIVASEHEVYVKMDEFALEAAPAEYGALVDRWWLLPAVGTGSVSGDLTPDPRLLRMQTEVIDVTRDRGIVMLDGRRVHHYDVAVNNAKFAAFLSSIESSEPNAVDPVRLEAQLQGMALSGEIWIDAETYVLRRAAWEARGPMTGGEPLMTMTVNVREQKTNASVSPPSDALPLPIEALELLRIPSTP